MQNNKYLIKLFLWYKRIGTNHYINPKQKTEIK